MPEIIHSKDNPANQAGKEILFVQGLTKKFGNRQAVHSIDFTIKHGECLGLLGPNGAGKTTTINILLGRVEKTAGEITVFDLPLNKSLREIKARIGVSPQDDNLDPDLTVEENLLTYGSYFNIPKQIARQRAEELLHFFALHNRRHEIIQHLSGGQRRRLLLARALINKPELLVMDEPTIGLDPQARYLIWDRLETLRANGTTMLLTSHYMQEVSRLCNRVLIMDQGQIVAKGEPQSMISELVGIDVFEVEGADQELRELEAAVKSCQVNTERVKDRLYIYTQEDCPQLEALIRPFVRWIRRPANLEDVFIQTTGRLLREA